MKNKARNIFRTWKRSKQLLHEQLYMCPSCMTPIQYNNMHVHHLYPISKITDSQYSLITDKNNLMLLCSLCNIKQSNKIDNRFK